MRKRLINAEIPENTAKREACFLGSLTRLIEKKPGALSGSAASTVMAPEDQQGGQLYRSASFSPVSAASIGGRRRHGGSGRCEPLTQNTSWRNVEMAIANLRKAKALSFRGLRGLPRERLSALIRPAGYYNIKAARLACLMEFFDREFGGNLDRARSTGTQDLRERLLAVKGIGRETADSILLYAFNRPMFVVDAYTRRFALRHGLLNAERITQRANFYAI